MKKSILFIFVLFVLCAPFALFADGSHFYTVEISNDQVNESMGAQQALMLKTDDAFTMYIQSSVKGDMTDFAWVLPLPGVPEKVEKAPEKLFEYLDEMTAPTVILYEVKEHDDNGCWFFGSESGSVDASNGADEVEQDQGKGQVIVIGSGEVGDFEYEIVKSESETALIKWLNDNKYRIPTKLSDIVASYIEDSFVFLAAKVKRDIDPDMDINSLPAMAIRFSIDTPMIYPMRLTALSAGEKVPVLLYAASKELPQIQNQEFWPETIRVSNSHVCSISKYQSEIEDIFEENRKSLIVEFREILGLSNDFRWFVDSDSGDLKRHRNYFLRNGELDNPIIEPPKSKEELVSFKLLKNLIEEKYVLLRWFGEPDKNALAQDIKLKTRPLTEDEYSINIEYEYQYEDGDVDKVEVELHFVGDAFKSVKPEIIRNVDDCPDDGGCQSVPEPFWLLALILISRTLYLKKKYS